MQAILNIEKFDNLRQEYIKKIQWCKDMFENTKDGYYYGLRIGYEHALFDLQSLLEIK